MDEIFPAGTLSHENLIRIAGIIAVSLFFFFIFYFIALLLLVNLPTDFLLKHQENPDRPPPGITRRIVGLFLLLLGGILSLPGVIGPGFLFVILGLIFLGVLSPASFGKYLSSHPSLINQINRLRARFGKPPLIRPHED